ncbi:Thiamine kinase [Arboricoccus pini]|uniref:Thiamine kinase n=1 Tax=Arboricoccus pini TaxID=1963835 RepID=A0A212RKR2_9PROT|nr:choline/ethanolamine kinase family protein [Arboricoccus pini]SNB72889.1 Thiamine kinase [Arboricoccus pini]
MTRRKLGEASSEAERRIEAAILLKPDWRGRAVAYEPVSGGISNANWRVVVEGAPIDYFVKIPGDGTEMFIDRRTALDAGQKASQLGIGPAVHPMPDGSLIEVTTFVTDRRSCTHSDFQDRAVRLAAIDTYRTLHSAPLLRATKTIFDMIEEHIEQAKELDSWLPPDFAWIMGEYRLARARLEASGLDLVPCFNDPMAGNFMVDDKKTIMLIDYEYAANNDRCYDLGVWFGEMFYPAAVELELIEAYFGRVDPKIVSRVAIHKALADVKWALWSFVQQKISTLEFDYFKYGVWKLLRLRTFMRDPEWVAHLSRI